MIASLTTPQQGTFQILGLRSNLASVEVLSYAMCSPFEPVRTAALQTLVARGGPHEMAAILERIDLCSEAELPTLRSQSQKLLDPIEAGLASRDPMRQQRSLCAIAKLELAPQFHHLVSVAQSPDNPQQIVAAELLIGLAVKFGTLARNNSSKYQAEREMLLSELLRSMELYDDHRINQIFDAWLCASHWEDEPFKAIFKPDRRDTIAKITLRQLKHSHRHEILEVLAGVLWSKKPFFEAIQLMADRKDHTMTLILADLTRRLGVTPVLRKNFSMKTPIHALNRVDFSSDSIPIVDRSNLLLLLAEAEVPPDKLLSSINQMLEVKDPIAEAACATAIRNLQSLKPEIIVMVLSDCFDSPDIETYTPPPWKAELRVALERLIELFPSQPSSVKSSIEFVLSDFQCEELFKHVDDWPEPHLIAYGKLVRLADRGFLSYLEREIQSHSSAKRLRALQIARYLGVDEAVQEIVCQSLSDASEHVRTEAVYTLANSLDIRKAIECISPMLRDDDVDVKVAAEMVLSRLETPQS